MKKTTPLDEIIDEFTRKKVKNWLDRLSFPAIMLVWITLVMIFGALYYFLTDNNTFLYYNPTQAPVEGILNHIYFSFITATTTGFGDIVPMGGFRVIAIVEVVLGFLLLAVVTSKFISVKQNVILEEIYEVSFHERINRLRSSLLIFRQNIGRIISRIEENEIKKREINDLYTYVSSFEDILREVYILIHKPEGSQYTKTLDPLNAEVVINSIINSFEKLNELIVVMDQNKIEWRREVTTHMMYKCINLNQEIFDNLNSEKRLSEKTMMDMNAHKSKAIDLLRNAINIKQEEIPKTEIIKN
jgi:hypothetical protein